MLRSILFAILVVLCYAETGKASPEINDSCLALLRDPDGTWHNPDSVKADSCLGSSTYGQTYAKQWYHVFFDYYILPTPEGPADTIIDRTWRDIDPTYTSIRNGFDSLEYKYGNFILRKFQPDVRDSSSGGDKIFLVRFDNYVNVDSAERDLDSLPMTSCYYGRRYGIISNVLNRSQIFDQTTKIIISRSSEANSVAALMRLQYSKQSQPPTFNCYDLKGALVFSSDTITPETVWHCIISLTNGAYCIMFGQTCCNILITD
jgi:hypothetical protein